MQELKAEKSKTKKDKFEVTINKESGDISG